MNLKNFYEVKKYKGNIFVNKETQEVYSNRKHKILKGFIMNGYRFFRINNNEKVETPSLHRIMMETFVPDKTNYKSLPNEDRSKISLDTLVINHKDGNKLNNSIDNLEWCTQAYNNKEAYRIGVRKVSEKTIKIFREHCVNIERATNNLKRYRQYCKENGIKQNAEGTKVSLTKDNETKDFISFAEAARFLGCNLSTVARASRRKNNVLKGYIIKQI